LHPSSHNQINLSPAEKLHAYVPKPSLPTEQTNVSSSEEKPHYIPQLNIKNLQEMC